MSSLEKILTGYPDWQAVKDQFLKLPEPLISELVVFIFSTSSQAKLASIKTNIRAEGTLLLEKYLHTLQLKPLLHSVQFFSNIFQTSLQRITKQKEIPLNLDFKEPIIAIVTILTPDNNKDTETQSIVALAQETLCEITDKIPFSANFLNRENTPITLDKFSQIDLTDILDNFRTYRKNVIHAKLNTCKDY